MSMINEGELKEIARLYELAGHERERAELQQRIAELEVELGGRPLARQSLSLLQRIGRFFRGNAATNAIQPLAKAELKELLAREEIHTGTAFDERYFTVPYKAVYGGLLWETMYKHPLVLIDIHADDFKAVRERDKIRRLNVHGVVEGGQLVELLAAYPNLEMLSFYCSRVGVAGAQAIASSQCMTNVTYLDLSDSRIGDEGAQAIATSEHMPRLRCLDIARNGIGDSGVQALASSPHMARLTYLRLNGNSIRAKGAQAIVDSQYLRNLTYLGLDLDDIGFLGHNLIRGSKHMERVTEVILEYGVDLEDRDLIIRG